jgi:uroporphyrinogen decarboxylase
MLKMTSRERFLTALNGKEPDMVPIHELLLSRPLYQEVLGYTPEAYDPESVCNLAIKIGYDSTLLSFGGMSTLSENPAVKEKEGAYTDEWGTVYQKHEATWPSDAPVGYPISNWEDLKNYVWPDPWSESRLDHIKVGRKMLDEHQMALIGSVRGPFSASWLLTGMPKFLLDFYDDPEMIDYILTRCTDFYIVGARRMAEAGVDAIYIADDYGFKTSPFMSPQTFEKYILPQLNRMVEAIRETTALPILHSDGYIQPLLDSIMNNVPLAGLNPLERGAGMDIAHVKKTYGHKVAIIGNVDQQTTLVSGTKEDVIEETKKCIKIAAPGGGYVLASDHSIHDDIPNENIFALYETGRKYGQYPINIPD